MNPLKFSPVKFSQDRIHLKSSFLRYDHYLVTVGVHNIQGHRTSPTYLNNGHFANACFELKQDDSWAYLRQVSDLKPIWKGVPVKLRKSDGYVDITDWLTGFSRRILVEAYMEYDESIELKGVLSTEYNRATNLKSGIQLSGYIKDSSFEQLAQHSIEFSLNLLPLGREIMIPRIGDQRIGYFYQEILNREESSMFNDPYIIINRRNLGKAPWIYVIESSVPKRFWDPIRQGVEHWNQYFDHLGLGRPILVLDPDHKDYPEGADIFDAAYNYVVNHSTLGLNANYTGISQTYVDFRSGEILFGNIYLNFERMETIGLRYFYLYQNKRFERSIIQRAINNCIVWVVGHELGHQLGLRHNFVGNEMDDGYGSIMDYIEFFDHYEKFSQQDYTRLRTYDLHAIKYGYLPIESEKPGQKPTELEDLGDEGVPFKTDDHFFNGIIPNVGRLEDERDILSFIGKAIDNYRSFREVLIEKITGNTINPYQFANGFLFIYINRYRTLLSMLCRYIGGRYIDFKFYRAVSLTDHIRSLTLLLKLKRDLKYSQSEYQYLIYDFSPDLEHHSPVIKVELDEYNYYGFNSTDLFLVFQNLTKLYMERLMDRESIIRLNGGSKQHSHLLFYELTFCVEKENDLFGITGINGIFPEIGLLMLKDDRWREVLSSSDIFDQYCQYQWISQLVALKQSNEHYFIQMVIEKIFSTVERYRKAIEKALRGESDSLLLSHYTVIWEKIANSKKINYTWQH
jgi:hypothetical protein